MRKGAAKASPFFLKLFFSMNAILQKLGGILDKGADYVIAREQSRDASRLPAQYMTPAEQVVQTPAPSPIVENDRITGTQSNPQGLAQKVFVGVAVASVTGLVLYGVKGLLKGSKS